MTLEQYLLIKLAEECAEVQHRAFKALTFGLDEKQTDGHETNRARLIAEMRDLETLFYILGFKNIAPLGSPEEVRAAMLAKAEKLQKYINYSVQLGVLEPGASIQ